MFTELDHNRIVAMTDQERRWLNNIKKAIYEADRAYAGGSPQDRCFEEMCKAADTAKTLRRSLLGAEYSDQSNKRLFTEFLDLEVPTPERGGMNLVLFDSRKGCQVRYSFSSLIYCIRCMVHENENLNAAEQPDYHVLLDWTMNPNDRHAGFLEDGAVKLNARLIWMRLREVVTKFVWGLEAVLAVERGGGFEMNRELCSIRPDGV